MTKKSLASCDHPVDARKCIEQLLNQQALPMSPGTPIRKLLLVDHGAIRESKKYLLVTNRCHPRQISHGHCQQSPRQRQKVHAFQASWRLIEPAMHKVGELLQDSGVGNLYWVGPLSQGSDCKDESFEFLFPPWVPDSLMDQLAVGIFQLIEESCGPLLVHFHAWYELTTANQLKSAARAIPIFKSAYPSTPK